VDDSADCFGLVRKSLDELRQACDCVRLQVMNSPSPCREVLIFERADTPSAELGQRALERGSELRICDCAIDSALEFSFAWFCYCGRHGCSSN